MKIEICDICGEKMYENNKKYAINVKERKSTITYENGMCFQKFYWHKIDVCCFCKNAIVELSKKNRKESENDIN